MIFILTDKNELYYRAGLSSTEIYILKLISYAFGNENINKNNFADADWYEIFRELKNQAVEVIPVGIIENFSDLIPSGLYESWIIYSAQVLAYAKKISICQENLTSLLKSEGITPCIMKGMSAALYYPYPFYRYTGDIDFLVNRKDFERAFNILSENGYVLKYAKDNTDYHYTLFKDGIYFELHIEPSGIAKNEKGDMIRNLFDFCCENPIKAKVEGSEFYMLPKLQNGLVLLMHIVKHLDEGIGLRQICDWLAFVNSEVSNEVFENEFKQILEETGLLKLALVTTKMCKIYLGINPKITWCDCADDRNCAEFMKYIFDNGNFGSKNKNTKRTMAVLGETRSPEKFLIFKIFSSLQKNGEQQWKALKKHPGLKIFAWAYIPLRYLKRIFTGKRSMSETKNLVYRIKKQKKIEDILKIYK